MFKYAFRQKVFKNSYVIKFTCLESIDAHRKMQMFHMEAYRSVEPSKLF